MPTTTGLATSFITFSRPGATGGGATVTDQDGKIKWAGHNLLLASESFDASAWSKNAATIAANAVVAPSGATTADTLTATGAGCYLLQSYSAISGRVSVSVIAKPGTNSSVTLRVAQAGNGYETAFTLSGSGTAGTPAVVGTGGTVSSMTAAISALSDSWYLCTITFSETSLGNVFIMQSASSGTIHLWGAHLYRSDMQMQLNPAMPAGMQSYYPTTPRNLLGSTEDFSAGYWTKDNILAFGSGSVANAAVAPNGLQTADLIVPNTTSGTHGVYRSSTITSSVDTYSIYVKPAGYSKIAIREGNATGAYSSFNLSGAGSVLQNSGSSTGAITALSDGWYRISIVLNAASSARYYEIWILPDSYTTGSVTAAWTPNGTSGIYLWGAQLSDSASLDTYVPQYGAAVTSAAYYAPRLDYDGATLSPKGLLVEEQRVNLVPFSETLDASQWTYLNSVSIDTAAGTSPTGANTALKFKTSTVSGGHVIFKTVAASVVGSKYTCSVYVKKGEYNWAQVGDVNVGGAYVNLTTGEFGTVDAGVVDKSAVSVGNGWWRVSVTTTAVANSGPIVGLAPANGGVSTAGANNTDGIYVYGIQWELGSFSTSYIPTIGNVTATRAADVASVSTQAFPYSASEGTLVASASWANAAVATVTNQRIVMMGSAGDLYARQIQRQDNSATGVQVFYRGMSGVTNISTTGNAANAGLAWSSAGGSASVNGSSASALTGTPTTYDGQPINTLRIGNAGDSTFFNGHIRQITYIPRRLSNAELQSRTA